MVHVTLRVTALLALAVHSSIQASSFEGTGCETIDGEWINQHGSELLLSHSSDGVLNGTYTTAVESEDGASGSGVSDLVGAAPYDKPGSTFGFSVMWLRGKSTTVWTGQCHMCGDEATLMTSWVLRSKVNECGDKWKAIQIGQDYFKRKGSTYKFDAPLQAPQFGSQSPLDLNEEMEQAYSSSQAADDCSLIGEWHNYIGSKLELKDGENGILRGQYWTAREVQAGKLSGTHSSVYGQYNHTDHEHTFAFFVVWNEGESVTGWVGQCHMCPEGEKLTARIETTWLHRLSVTSCHANWRSTLYGTNSFLPEVQRPVDPDEDLEGEFGEAVGVCPVDGVNGSATFSSAHPVLVLQLLICHLLAVRHLF